MDEHRHDYFALVVETTVEMELGRTVTTNEYMLVCRTCCDIKEVR